MMRVVGLLTHVRRSAGGKHCQSGLTDSLHELELRRDDEINGAPRSVVLVDGGAQEDTRMRRRRIRREVGESTRSTLVLLASFDRYTDAFSLLISDADSIISTGIALHYYI